MVSRNFSLTDESFPVKEIVEPITIIPQKLRMKDKELSENINSFLEFLMKKGPIPEHDEHKNDNERKNCEICTVQRIPYPLRPENRTEYKPYIQTLEKSMTYAITTAKLIRLELYNPLNEEIKYNMPEDMSNLPKPEEAEKPQNRQNKIKQMLGMKRTVTFDPNSPMAKMEELIAGLTEILNIFDRWLKWFEGLILEGLSFNTPKSLQTELNQLIRIFGTDVEPNIWIAFQYHKDLREQDAEHYALEFAKAIQKQEHTERNDWMNQQNQQQPQK